MRNNKLTSLDLSQQTQLQEVKADYNQLAEFQLGENPNLTSLELNNNKLTKLDLTQQLALKKFTAFNNPLYDITLPKSHEFDLFSVEGSPYAAALTTTSQANEEKNISNLLSPRVSIIEGGVITQEGKEYTVTPTQMVMPKLGQYIGFRYSVTLPKNAQGEVEPSLAKTNKFPITVRMTHPKIVDPKTGKGFTESTWPDTMFKHDRNLAMWYFGDKSELVSGRWQLEILYRDSVVAKKPSSSSIWMIRKNSLQSRKLWSCKTYSAKVLVMFVKKPPFSAVLGSIVLVNVNKLLSLIPRAASH